MTLFLNSVMVVEVINKKTYCSVQLQAQTMRATSLTATEICFTESHKMYRRKTNHNEHNFFPRGTPSSPHLLLLIHVGKKPASAVCFYIMPHPYSFCPLLVLSPLLTVFNHFLSLILWTSHPYYLISLENFVKFLQVDLTW